MNEIDRRESLFFRSEKFSNRDLFRIVKLLLLITSFFVLSALTAALPSSLPYGNTGNVKSLIDSGDTAWVITASALVLLMTPAVGLFYGGMVNSKNVISTMYQSFVSMGVISVIWVIIGFSLAFGDDLYGSGIIGNPSTYYMFKNVGAMPDPNLAPTIPLTIASMFQLMFAIITPITISGSGSERGWLIFIALWHLGVYCPLAHMVWHQDGVLKKWGYIDFAGGLVVETAAGSGALAMAMFLGPRSDKMRTPANIPFVLMGTGLLWFGWIGFNGGSALSSGELACQAVATTNTAAAAAMLTWILINFVLDKTSSAVGACNGALVGLVAITPGCGYVTVGGAMCIGCIACLICYMVGAVFNRHTGIDDSLDVFVIHGLGGMCGIILTGVFSCKNVNPAGNDGIIYGGYDFFGKQLAVALVAFPILVTASWICCVLTNAITAFRATEEQEKVGLDITMHSESLALQHSESSALLTAKDTGKFV